MGWQGRTGGGNLGQRLMVVFFRCAGLRAGYAVMGAVVPFYMLFAAGRARAIYHYFRRRHNYGLWKAFARTYRNHYLFATAMLDRFAVYAGRGGKFRVEVTGDDDFRRALDRPQGAMVLGSHVGNFELAGYLLPQDKKPINAIIFGGEAATVQAHRDERFTQSNIRTIPVAAGDMAHIFLINDALSRGELVSMPADRVFTGSKVRECDFLGGRATFPMGAFRIAQKLQVGMFALFAMRTGTMRYRVYVFPLQGATGEEMQADYVRHLEAMLREYPEQWYNFYEFWHD